MAGEVTQTLDKYPGTSVRILTFAWTGDAANGTVPSTATSDDITKDITGWFLYAVETNPGAVAPTAAYDVVINDAEGFDIAGGQAANRSATATERVLPKLDATSGLLGAALIYGALTLVITNQNVNSATGTVKLILSK